MQLSEVRFLYMCLRSKFVLHLSMHSRSGYHPGLASLSLCILLLVVGLVSTTFLNANLNWPGYLSVIMFYGVIFYIALSYRGTDRLLADRSMPLWLGVFTMSATWVGGGFVNGAAEYTYSEGLIWVQAPWGYALSLIVGGLIFVRPMRARNFTTLLDPLEAKFGRRSNLLFFLPALMGDLFWTSAILVALGTTFGTLLGLDMSTSIILSGAIVIIYTAAGGLWSVAITDVVQLLILMVGLIIVVWDIVGSQTGLLEMIAEYKDQMGEKARLWPRDKQLGSSTALWWDSALLLVFGGIPWQVYFQRVLAAKSTRVAVRLSILAGFICLLAAIPPILIGMVGQVTDWAALGVAPPGEAANILPHVVRYMCNPIVATLGLGAIAAAVMSSSDSSILACSTVIVWNVLPAKHGSSQRMIQKVIWVVGVVTIIIALEVGSIYELWFLCSDLVYCLLFPALVTSLFDPKANYFGAVSGFFVALVLRLGGGEAILNIPPWIGYPVDEGVITIPYKTIAMLSGLITIVVVSRIYTRFWHSTSPSSA